ncbi:MAG: YqeG family HAD IIIA-type phosphatase [Coriobacteriia bacterium]|nr:YqeG family HAD IIIA-type phosphatase [Coriobacteriia bacterium]MBN2823560.1 YqeG family HAD IIIA-type phosphatase [Coriobacteriia bacterium]
MAILRPSQRVADVRAIDLGALEVAGVSGLMIDLDNTLLPRDTSIIPPEIEAWIAEVKVRFRVCLVSNNWHERVHEVAAELELPLVAKAIKPLPFAFLKALRTIGLSPRRCAVIGDQLLTDILGGNIIGAKTIMVDPLSQTDLPHTLLLRKLEARIMKDDPGTKPTPVKDETCE